MAAILLESFTHRKTHDNARLDRSLAQNIWQVTGEAELGHKHLMSHYNSQSSLADEAYLSLNTHKDAVDLINTFKDSVHRSKEELTDELKASASTFLNVDTPKAVGRALKFALSLWLFVDDQTWLNSERVTTYLAKLFPQNRALLATELGEDGVDFNAHDLERIGGFELKPTSCLKDHLRFDAKAGRVHFFRHAIALMSRDDPQADLAYPDGLLEETAATLSLLFPFGESPHKKWKRRIHKTADVDVELGIACNTSTALSDYKYWGKRLQIIQDAYDKVEPRTLGQWLHDWRKPNRTWTFWLAFLAILLTLVFGLIQSVTGIVQAVKS